MFHFFQPLDEHLNKNGIIFLHAALNLLKCNLLMESLEIVADDILLILHYFTLTSFFSCGTWWYTWETYVRSRQRAASVYVIVFIIIIFRQNNEAHVCECHCPITIGCVYYIFSDFARFHCFNSYSMPLACVWVTGGNPCGHRGGHSRDRSEATRFRKEAELWEEPRFSLPFKLMRLRTGSQLGLASYTIVSFLHSVCIFSPVCGNTRFQFLKRFYCQATPRKWVGTIPTAKTRWC